MNTAGARPVSRRQFLGMLGGLALGMGGVGAYAWRIEPEWLEVVPLNLPIRGLPAALEGARLVQLTDIHVGRYVPYAYLERAVDLTASLAPDMLVITGDFMHYDGPARIAQIVALLRRLPPARLGAWAVLGNHDYGARWKNLAVANMLVNGLAGLNIRVLRNQAVDVGGLQLVGIDDLWSPRFRPEDVVPRVNWAGPALTLCHNPDGADTGEMREQRGWILAGHTHGGQVRLPFVRSSGAPALYQLYLRGAYNLGGGRWMYINRGLGFRLRARLGVRPEITLFSLRRA